MSFPLLANVSTVFPILSKEASLDFVVGLFFARHDSIMANNCIKFRARTLHGSLVSFVESWDEEMDADPGRGCSVGSTN